MPRFLHARVTVRALARPAGSAERFDVIEARRTVYIRAPFTLPQLARAAGKALAHEDVLDAYPAAQDVRKVISVAVN